MVTGNDWWYVGGAAAGGVVLGVVGSSLFRSAPEPVFTGITREYRKGKGSVLMGIFVSPMEDEKDRYQYNSEILDQNVPITDEAMIDGLVTQQILPWVAPQYAAEETDYVFLAHKWKPVDEWNISGETNISTRKPVSARISGGARQRSR